MKEFWSKRIKNLVPYVAGEQPKDKKYIKLNTNENPYPPSPKVMEAIRHIEQSDRGSGLELRLYPDTECTDMKKAVCEVYGLSENMVFTGNGSDEVLALCFLAFFDEVSGVCFADISYSFYPVYASIFGVKNEVIPLNGDFTLPVEKFLGRNMGVLLANPNAPTGLAVGLSDIERIVSSNKSLVIVDEAYVDFGGESAVALLDKYPNLLIIRTLSKSCSLAGLRLSWAAGNPNLIAALETVKNSFNSYTVDRIAQAAGAAAIRDYAYMRENADRVIATRERTAARLRELGFGVLDSKANFLFAEHDRAEELFKGLKERGVLVRWFNKPRINRFLRISIGTDEEMDRVLEVIRELVK
jgi:histidinol-phosphate aminotransferase